MSLLLLLAACTGAPPTAPPSNGATMLARSDVAVVARESISSGPRVAGTLEAAERAVIRSEAAGSVESVGVEVGQRVQRGDLLARIEATAAREGQVSARSGVTAAEQDLRIAERELERATKLVDIGALAARDREMAESAVISARARWEDARARRASADEQVDGATVRAPIDGIVSERAVSQGDIVAPGSPLFTVLEPSSLRLSGAVPADAIGLLKVGSAVQFSVQGHPGRTFAGMIERIAPAVDPVTRQLPVLVSIPNAEGELVAGLFAEGHVAAEVREGLLVPTDALVAMGADTAVLLVRGGKVEQVTIKTGLRNDATERVEVTEGVSPGDTVIVGPAREVPPGTAVQVAAGEG